MTGDTVTLHAPRSNRLIAAGKQRVEIVMNGRVVAHQDVPADGRLHHLEFQVPVEQSSWIALRQFPQLHTNPVRVVVGGKPIRASRASARWCAETVRLLWDSRHHRIAENEREAAYQAYQRAIATYERRAAEARARELEEAVLRDGRRAEEAEAKVAELGAELVDLQQQFEQCFDSDSGWKEECRRSLEEDRKKYEQS